MEEVEEARDILLVEDQEELRQMVKDILMENGYRVQDAPTGGEALEICRQNGHQFQLLVTDVFMPDCTGLEVSEKIREYYPDINILYMSGYHDKMFAEVQMDKIEDKLLKKPFTHEELRKKLTRY